MEAPATTPSTPKSTVYYRLRSASDPEWLDERRARNRDRQRADYAARRSELLSRQTERRRVVDSKRTPGKPGRPRAESVVAAAARLIAASFADGTPRLDANILDVTEP
jgi:hypothetical protein